MQSTRRSRLVNRVLFYLAMSGAAAAGETAAVDAPALERLVRQDCGSCHGLTLKGGLGPDIRPDALAHYDADTLSAVILDGVPGTPMPPWRPLLTQPEVDWIVTYLLNGDTR
ncbi:c-type cytochrome [Sedimentitalea nanhaiensis]|uniref:Cytochrome c55X n=1 Tax=Sedimentitalea nanhaiensis TaxID=999627 RepID=A0A1I6XKV9_9RHOB|nr:cytochrome c55X [Sedimentitalea nanhaiensis]